jgi:broad specificity phosphatase PhoE
MTMETLLLRHGETEWNETGRMQGRSDTLLTPVGIEQALEAARKLPHFDRIVTSDLKRASVTAELIGAQCGCPVTTDQRLRERSWGVWEGMLPSEVDEQWPSWRATGRKPPEYEMDSSVKERMWPLFQELAGDESLQRVLLVSHGGLMVAVVRLLGGNDLPFKNLEGQWLSVDRVSVSLLQREAYVAGARRLER